MYRNNLDFSKLQASCKSELIDCSYFIRATIEYNTFLCCVDNPSIDVPIIIYIPEIERENLNYYKPHDWSPIMMPPAQVNLPSAQDIGILPKPSEIQRNTIEEGEKVMTIEELLKRKDIKILDTPETQEIISEMGLSKDMLVKNDSSEKDK